MKKLSFAKSAIALVVFAGAAVAANAATYNLGTLVVGNSPTSFNAYHSGTGLVSFDDDFKFSLDTAGITGGSVLEILIPGLTGAQFSSVALYAGLPSATPGTPLAVALGTNSARSFSGAVTPAGSYFLRVQGEVDAGSATLFYAAYNGAISVAAAPVPEPESYAMFLAGLGIMGAIAVRRNKAKKS